MNAASSQTQPLEELQELCEPLVRMAARREQLEAEDLSQQAYLAALEALGSWREERGCRRAWVSGKVRAELSEYCALERRLHGMPLRLPRSVWRQLRALGRARHQMQGQRADDRSVASMSGLSERQVKKLTAIAALQPAAEEIIGGEDPLTLLIEKQRRETLLGALSRLSPAQKANLSSGDASRRRRALAALSSDRALRPSLALAAWLLPLAELMA